MKNLLKEIACSFLYFINCVALFIAVNTQAQTTSAFIDGSLTAKTVTAYGDANVVTGQSKFSGPTGTFDGAGDYLTVSPSPLDATSKIFTIEAWIYITSVPANGWPIVSQSANVASGEQQLFVSGSNGGAANQNKLRFSRGSGAGDVVDVIGSTSLPLNQWVHVALSVDGATAKLFVNGNLDASAALTTGWIDTAQTFYVATTLNSSVPANQSFAKGKISDLRITKSSARYKNAFIPYAAETIDTTQTFDPNWANDALLLTGNGRNGATFVADQSPNIKSLTTYGNSQITTVQSKFGGSSLYFDGNGDYLLAPHSSDFSLLNDFTVEAWIRPASYTDAFGNVGIIVSKASVYAVTYPHFVFYLNASGYLAGQLGRAQISQSSITITSASTIPLNSWSHVAFVRTGSVLKLFINGVQSGSDVALTVTPLDAASGLAVGQYYFAGASTSFFNGYIDDLRVTNGVARYTSSFSPTEIPPIPAKVGDTQWNKVLLLLNANGNNGVNMFTDLSASSNVISTLGNAQVSTTQSKFGGASALFHGNGDYLSITPTQNFQLGSDDFTIESWVQPTAFPGGTFYPAIISQRTNYTNNLAFSLELSSTGNAVNFSWSNNGSSPVTFSGAYTFALNTWYHIAAVRSGGTVTLYVNGSSIASAAISGAIFNSSATIKIGAFDNPVYANSYFTGYIDDLRITKGLARYTTTFTPSTTQLEPPRFIKDPYSSRVSLLLLSGASAIDTVPPYVTTTSKQTNVNAALDSITVNFSKAIEPTSFTTAQVTLTDASQNIIPVISIAKVSTTQYKLNFVPAVAAGTYNLRIWQDVLGTNGLPLDQNKNGTGGELLDVFDQSIVVSYSAPAAVTPVINPQGSGTSTSMTLAWPTYTKAPNGRDISSFRIYVSLSPYTNTSQATKALEVAGTVNAATVTGLLNNATYYVAVVPVDSAGTTITQVTPVAVTLKAVVDQTTAYTYNAAGQVLTEDGPRVDVNDITTYTYDTAGNKATMTNALGQVIHYNSYDGVGNLLSVTDANGITTLFNYNDRGWLMSSIVKHPTTSALDSTTSYTYDAVGQMLTMTLPNGYQLSYEYDDARRLSAIHNAAGERIEYTLDKAGNRTQQVIKNSTGAITYSVAQAFDELSRVMSITGNHGQNEQHKYDTNDNNTLTIDGRSNQNQQVFDALNRVTKVIDPALKETKFTYDAQNRINTVTDARGNITTYTYDGLGNLISQSSPDTGTTRYSYDAAGNRTSAVDARGIVVNYTYDAINRLTAVSYPAAATENVTYTYDSTTGGSYGIGRLAKVTNGTTSLSYVYNHQGLITQKTAVVNSLSRVTNYTYDTAGNLASITYPTGRIVSYLRDYSGRIQSVKTKFNSTATEQTVVSGINYLPFGPTSGYTYGNGLSYSLSYDTDYRLTAIQLGGIMSRSYSYDAVDNITKITDGITATKTQDLTYDNLNRLSSANGTYGYQAFSYDAVGNRTGFLADNGAAISSDTYTYETTTNRLSQIDKTTAGAASGTRTFHYDSAGNRTQGTGDDGIDQTYIYNNANRLNTAKVNAALVGTYVYNPLGQRASKTYSDNSKEIFFYNEAGQLISVLNSSGTILREYIYNGDTLVGYVTGGILSYVHNDHHNTPQVVTAQNQNVIWMADYEPFGKAKVIGGNTITFTARFPGQYLDSETGNYYNYFRDYDPSIGRYIESDPIGLRGGINTYVYVSSSPVNFIDPYGLFQFGHRPLDGTGGIEGPQTNGNDGVYHEHGFYQDGTGDNIGFFKDKGDGHIGPDIEYPGNKDEYTLYPEHYDDARMRRAQQNVDSGKYNVFTNNCQDYADKLRDEYNRLLWEDFKRDYGPLPNLPSIQLGF